MSDNLVPYSKKGKTGRGIKKAEPIKTGDLVPVLDLVLQSCTNHMGRPAYYPDTREGMEQFIQETIEFFEYVQTVNDNPDLEEKQKLIPDIELWCTFLGISRMTLLQYEKRGGEWGSVIGYYKSIIGGIKKQLALHNKIPSLVFLFDSANNHQYFNSNSFMPTEIIADTKQNSIDEQARRQGIAWDNELKKFVPAED